MKNTKTKASPFVACPFFGSMFGEGLTSAKQLASALEEAAKAEATEIS